MLRPTPSKLKLCSRYIAWEVSIASYQVDFVLLFFFNKIITILLLQLLWCWKLPISAFSQRWGFNNFVWILQERVIVAFFHRLHRSRLRNLHFCGLWLWRYVSVQCLLSVVFLALWFVNFFLTLNFKASIIYRFFSLSVTCGYLWYFRPLV